METYNQIVTDTQEKLEVAHERRLGSSSICTVAGLNKFETRLQLWARMTGKAAKKEETMAMFMGKLLEDDVAAVYQRENAKKVLKKSEFSYIPADKPWMIATPDYFAFDMETNDPRPTILECKTTSAWGKQYWENSVPDYAHCQVQWQMGICGHDHATVACLIGGAELITHEVPFAKDVFEQLTELGALFMKLVESETPPEPSGADLEDLQKRLSPTEGKVIEPDDEIDNLVLMYLHFQKIANDQKAALKDAKEAMDEYEAKILSRMGDASMIVDPNKTYEVRRTRTFRKAYQVKETWVERFNVKEKSEG